MICCPLFIHVDLPVKSRAPERETSRFDTSSLYGVNPRVEKTPEAELPICSRNFLEVDVMRMIGDDVVVPGYCTFSTLEV